MVESSPTTPPTVGDIYREIASSPDVENKIRLKVFCSDQALVIELAENFRYNFFL